MRRVADFNVQSPLVFSFSEYRASSLRRGSMASSRMWEEDKGMVMRRAPGARRMSSVAKNCSLYRPCQIPLHDTNAAPLEIKTIG